VSSSGAGIPVSTSPHDVLLAGCKTDMVTGVEVGFGKDGSGRDVDRISLIGEIVRNEDAELWVQHRMLERLAVVAAHISGSLCGYILWPIRVICELLLLSEERH
jgi:hypothetical protein